jgi:stage II sporulation protein AB (anti-sigma F factor)
MAPTHSTYAHGCTDVPVPQRSNQLRGDSRLEGAIRSQAASMSRLRLHLAATREEVPFARAAITRVCEHLGVDDGLTDAIRLAVTEACSNCAIHAYDGHDGSATYLLDARAERDVLRIIVSDRGIGIDESRAHKLRSLGFGLEMIEQLADTSSVSARLGGGTRVVMRFSLAASRSARREAV